MDSKRMLYFCMGYLWFSLHAERMLLIVTAQTLITLEILTPESDRKEGGQTQMECSSTNFDFQNYTWEWQKDGITLKRNEETITSDQRLSFSTILESNMITTDLLSITGVNRNDSGMYKCNAIYRGTSSIVSTVQVTLSVLYFPFPICSPDGPITEVAGTELNIQCSSEVGNPQVMMEINQTKYIDAFTSSRHGDMISMDLALVTHVDYSGIFFVCTLTSLMYYPGMNHSCFIGPIIVSIVTEPTTTYMTESTHLTSPTYPSHNETITVPTIAGAVAGVVVLISIIILIIFCRSRPGLCKIKQSSEDNTSITIPMTTASPRDNNSDPFQPSFNKDYGIEHKHNNQNRAAEEVTSPAPESSLSHSGTTLPRRAEVPDSNNLIYTKQLYVNYTSTIRPGTEHGVTTITEQSYTNPIFGSNSTENAKRPFEDHPKSFTKPMAKVKPNISVPNKPAPYRPKSDRTSNNNDGRPTHGTAQVDDGADTRQEASLLPSDVTYAQVSVPIRQNSSSSQRPGDDVTYAELDLTSHTTQDDGVKPSSSAAGAAIYATVNKK